MNILLLTTHFNTGGISVYLLTLAQGLKRRGHNIIVASSGGNLVERLTASGIRHVTINVRTKSEVNPKLIGPLFFLARLIKEENIDVIHAHTRVTQVMANLLSRMTQRPYVTTCHGFYKTHFFRRVFPCWGYKSIAISQSVFNHLKKDFQMPNERIALVPNGIDVTQYVYISDEMRAAARKKWNCGPSPVIGIIARLADVKGHDVLLKAMAIIVTKLPQAQLWIVGDGKQQAFIKAMIGELGLGANVRMQKSVFPTTDILPVFDVFVLPSLDEGLGLSLMEAQVCGLPVVASKVGGIIDLVENHLTGLLVKPGDHAELAEKILYMFNHPQEAKTMGLKAREKILIGFCDEKMTSQTENVYSDVVRR